MSISGYPDSMDRGYILFAAPGDWKVTVRQGKTVIGSVVYRVTTAS